MRAAGKAPAFMVFAPARMGAIFGVPAFRPARVASRSARRFSIERFITEGMKTRYGSIILCALRIFHYPDCRHGNVSSQLGAPRLFRLCSFDQIVDEYLSKHSTQKRRGCITEQLISTPWTQRSIKVTGTPVVLGNLDLIDKV